MDFYNSSGQPIVGGNSPANNNGHSNPHPNQEANTILRDFQGNNDTTGVGIVLRDFQDVTFQTSNTTSSRNNSNPSPSPIPSPSSNNNNNDTSSSNNNNSVGTPSIVKQYRDNPFATPSPSNRSNSTNSTRSTSSSSTASPHHVDLEGLQEEHLDVSNVGIRGGRLINIAMTDESSEKEHDQLPPINDVLMHHFSQRGNRGNRDLWRRLRTGLSKFNLYSHRRSVRLWSYGIVVFSIVVLFASILGLSVHLSQSNRASGSGAVGGDSLYTTTMFSRSGQMISLVSGTISDSSDMIQMDSAQRKAIQFLAQDDENQIPIPTSLVEETNENPDADIDAFLQRYAIIVLAFALGGRDTPLESDLGFFSDEHECRWHKKYERPLDGSTMRMGITCNEHDQIEKVVLQTLGLTGSLPREIGLLTNLKTLRLDDNNITSLLPNHMKKCDQLEQFSMSLNHLHGHLDEWIGLHLTNLKELELSYNDFGGSLPGNFSQLTNLEILALDHNSLHGNVNTFLRKLTSLREIYLAHNNFGGHLSAQNSFHQLTNLRVMDISSNKLMGTFPMNIFSLPSLTTVDLHNNAISGPIAIDAETPIPANCPVRYLDVSENFITGSIPTSIANMEKLRHFDVTTNRMDGPFPNSMRSLTDLEYLYLMDNAAFTPSPIPHWFRFLTNLKEVSLMNTARTGEIPNAFEYLAANLEILNLGVNQLSGTIPPSLGAATSLQYLLLNKNLLTGTVPRELGNLQNLKLLTVDHNHLVGTISKEVCSIPDMTSMVADCADSSSEGDQVVHNEPQIECPCCTQCCAYNQEGCNNGQYLMEEYKSEWSHPYHRDGHIFAPPKDQVENAEVKFTPFTF